LFDAFDFFIDAGEKVKYVNITFARGDSYERGIVLKDRNTKQPILTAWDEVYFTVKKYHTDHDFKFQKRLSDGGIVYDGEGHYTLFILPEDTNRLAFGEYDIDFEFVKGDFKRTFAGVMKLTKEVTHQYNE